MSLRAAARVLVVAAAGWSAFVGTASAEPFVFTDGNSLKYNNGSTIRVVTTGSGDPNYPPEWPALAPDGQRVAYADGCAGFACGSGSYGNLYITSIDGGPGQVISSGYGVQQTDPNFLSNGRTLTFARVGGSQQSWDIWTVDVNGGNERQIVGWANGQLRPDFSPDGSRLTFTSYSSSTGATYSDGSKHVWVTSASGAPQKDLGIGWSPSFSPDGNRIAFERGGQLYVVNVDGSGLKQLTRSKTTIAEPDWGNGNRIIYRTSAGALAAINADGTGATSLGTGTFAALQQTSRLTDSDLLATYSPVMRYDAFENYYADDPAVATNMYQTAPPSAAERVGHNELITEGGQAIAYSSPPTIVGSPSQLTLGFLNTPTYTNNSTSALSTDSINLRGTSEGDYIPDSQYMHNQSIYGNKVYSRKVVDGATTWLQYWFFYYYNVVPGAAQVGDHEGDWEMVQVGLDAQQTPQVMTFAAHDTESISCPWSSVEKVLAGGDYAPQVFVAQGSHASYPHAGTWTRTLAIPNDVAGGQVSIRPTMVHGALGSAAWSSWPGFWGNSHGDTFYGETPSPHGPAFQSQRWSSPSAFNSGARACPATATRSAGTATEGRIASAPRPTSDQRLPTVAVEARKQRGGARIDYRLSALSGAGAKVRALLLSIDPKGDRSQPRTFTYQVKSRTDTVRQSLPIKRSGLKVRAAVLMRDGRRGPVSTGVIR